jgi:serine/threonine protein kinase
MTNVATLMIGQQLKSGWTIRALKPTLSTATGGCFSYCFLATNDKGAEAFVKILDIKLDETLDEPLVDLQMRIQKFNYESDIALSCAEQRLSRVAHAIDRGIISPSGSGAQYPYLLFERAAGDLREQLTTTKYFGPSIAFQVLHDVATAVMQLHGKRIAHQDIKPSNVLNFEADGHKVGDFGSAHFQHNPRPGRHLPIAGDPTYAPPEQLYQYSIDDWLLRRLMSDVYHVGSLALFLFTGDGATTQLARALDPSHHWEVWTGSSNEVMPYIRRATADIISKVRQSDTLLTDSKHHDFVAMLRCLLEPDPSLRGHPSDRAEGVSNGMQRFISRFDVFSVSARLGH